LACDDAYTKALLHYNGANGSTTFTDETGDAWTVVGTAQLSTAQFKWTSSGLFDGDSDYIYRIYDPPGTGAFTYDCWVWANGLSGYNSMFASCSGIGANGGQIYSDPDKKLILYDASLRIQGTTVMSTGAWYHIAIVGNGGADGARTIKLYLNGAQEGATYTVDYNWSNTVLNIGAHPDHTTGQYWNGHNEEFRYSKGIQRWTSDFSASLPTQEYIGYVCPVISTVDTFNAPTINTMFVPVVATEDTFNAPTPKHAITSAVISTIDTFNAPTLKMNFTIPTVYTTHKFNPPTATIPVKRKRVGVNW